MYTILKVFASQYGFGAAMAGFCCFLLYFTLKWTKENIANIITSAVRREKAQRSIIHKQLKAFNTLSKEVELTRKKQTEDHAKMSDGLTEIVKSLGRINGFKK